MKVVKFGGSSMANAAQIKKVCDIVLSDSERRIMVVSAPGKRDENDTKVTDMLIDLASAVISKEEYNEKLEAVVERYASIARDFNLGDEIVDTVRNDLQSRIDKRPEDDAKFMDLMKAAGEDNSAKIIAAYLQSIGVDAKYINPRDAGLLLSDEFGNARVLPESYENLKALKNETSLICFPGFFGYSTNGEVVTFSRGGSDITGSVLAAGVDAEVYENFTDVDFVFAANPKVVKNPKAIPFFTYEEMRELSYAGFNVLHEETLEPVYRKGIKVNIRNTNNPTAPGTFIVPDDGNPEYAPIRPVVGVAADKVFMTIHVEKYMMNREIGIGRKILQTLEEEGVSYEHTPSGIDSISVIVKKENCPDDKLARITDKLYDELGCDKVFVENDLAILMMVGRGMTKKVGVAKDAAVALADANVNLRMINQGSSEVSIMFGINEKDAEKGVVALYNKFFLNRE